MTEDKLLISVVILAYNHEAYIGTCVKSVLAQAGVRMELLIVDDGSRDGTWGRIQVLSAGARACGNVERVEIATQTNRGTCATLNRLCAMARGDFVAIIASGDKYLPGAFATMVKPMLEDPSVGVVVGQNGFMDGEGRECYWDANQNVVYDASRAVFRTFNEYLRKLSEIDDNGEGFGSYEKLLRCNHIANGYLIRRAFLEKVLPFRKEAPLEDHWLHLQLSKICRYRAVPEMTFRYRWHAANSVKQMARMLAFRYRTLKCEERMTGRSTRTERVTFSFLGVVSLHKIETLEEKLKVFRIFGCDIVLRRKSLLSGMQLRVLAVVHVYYPELWPELASSLRSIDAPCELVITYCDEAKIAAARSDFPKARFLKCENVGYDVWPFIKALQSVNLDDYDVVVKLHTKRDMPVGQDARPFNGFLVDGPRWRNQLLRFVRTRETWSLTKRRLGDVRVGMVADRWVIVREGGVRFVAGTMFAVRAALLKPFQSSDYGADKFAPAEESHMGSFAHVCERRFGECVAQQSFALAGFCGSAWSFCLARLARQIGHFLFRCKVTSSGHLSVKFMKIPIYRSRRTINAKNAYETL